MTTRRIPASIQAVLLLILLLAVTSLVACPGGESGGDADTGGAANAGSGKTGAQIYKDKRCAMCHGEQREGVAGLGPPLKGMAQYWTVDRMVNGYFPDPIGYQNRDPRLRQMLEEYNKMKMPPVVGDPDDLRKLAEFLMSE